MKTITIQVPDGVASVAQSLTPEDWERVLASPVREREAARVRALAYLRALPPAEDEAEAERLFQELSDES